MENRLRLIKWYTAIGLSLGIHAVGYFWITSTFDFKPSRSERAGLSAWLVPLSSAKQDATQKPDSPQIVKSDTSEKSLLPSALMDPDQRIRPDSEHNKSDKLAPPPVSIAAIDTSFPDYATSNHLDQPPVPLTDVEPVYPDGGIGQQGTVVLRLLINEQGNVEKAVVLSAFPKEIFDLAASTAFEKAKFSPGRLLGVPVKSQLTIEVKFTPLNRGSSVTGNRR